MRIGGFASIIFGLIFLEGADSIGRSVETSSKNIGDAVEKIGESLERSSLSTAAAMEKVGKSMEKALQYQNPIASHWLRTDAKEAFPINLPRTFSIAS